MRRLLLAISAASLLAGCESPPPPKPVATGPSPWDRIARQHEVDYEMSDQVLFALDSAEVTPQAGQVIGQLAQDAHIHANTRVEVDGYTDTTGTPEYNIQLSRARAESVADVLAHNGVDPQLIVTHGFGETNLAVPTGDQVNEPRNRRVVVRVFTD